MITRRSLMHGTAATAAPASLPVFIKSSVAAENRAGKTAAPLDVDRAFVRIKEGLIHYRHAGRHANGEALPLYMMHAGPGSSKGLEGLVGILGNSRLTIAADTLGFGESVPPTPETPDLVYYADSVVRVWDALGLDKVDVYGAHTGANIGMEIAIAHPDRVRRLVFDGVALFDPILAADMLENYAPEISPQENGAHFLWAWNFIKNMGVYFPHYKQDAEHYLGKPPGVATSVHNGVMEVMKAINHYHKGYNAVFRQKTHDRLPLVSVPAFCMAHKADPLHTSVEAAAALLPNSTHMVLPVTAGVQEKASVIVDFLSS